MAKQFRLMVYTQEKQVLDEQVISIVVPAEDGYLGVLADHAALVTTLGNGILTIKTELKRRELQLSGGFMEVAANTATILADQIEEIPAA